ncbi:MICAL-like protein 2 isoform X2 [Mastacembelus armatus]|uniref:MICAL-like protein 2 isoform X2 n=1 Tax=Mastacembelus armatus TaxID=205130 RepID=UPI000E45E74F|nr:MICAL-like protein 2 isoform X2 [Mastacembelus armatus]
MVSPKDLREWCRVTCAHYPDVEIKNMSTSFRDGLAFCAIIHSHRPELIDFSSLSKDNVYQNNKLAFEVAETKLGIPALLDPRDMVSTKVPDSLSIITYVYQLYYYFNSSSYGPASLGSSHISVLNSVTKSKTAGLRPVKSSTHLETGKDHLSHTRTRTVCNLCFKPVYLIQRHLTDGKIYHRSCFRCKVCHNTLLPEPYTKGSDAGSLICTHQNSQNTHVDLNKQSASATQTGYFSLSGLAISRVPHYTKKTESRDRLVYKTAETEARETHESSGEEKDREHRDSSAGLKSMVQKPAPLHTHPTSVSNRTTAPVLANSKIQPGASKAESSSLGVAATEVSQPVPPPRQMLGSSAVPVPAPRAKTSQTATKSPAAGSSSTQSKSALGSSHTTSPTNDCPKVKTNHPWLTIIHPGPWMQLPPAPPLVPTPRSKPVSNLQEPWYRPKVPPPNPFGEDEDEDIEEEAAKHESADQISGNLTNSSGDTDAVVCSGDSTASECDGSTPPNRPEGVSALPSTAETPTELARNTCQFGSLGLDENGGTGGSLPDVTAGPQATSDEAQSQFFTRSLSVPALTFTCSQSPTEADESVTSCRSKPSCNDTSFDPEPAMPTSSRRAPAPGHGFPLIKRKVQTDQDVSAEDLQVEMEELTKHLDALEQRGVELEKNLRDCKNDKEEEQMLMDWFSLIHEKHVLVRRDTELVYLMKQQRLDESQADVEYDLRCLLNKPESEWSPEDRGRERQLMDELVAIIEQRNHIVSSLDQDRQREREEDVLWDKMMNNKEFQKEGLKELKKSKGKFNPKKVFKMFNHKAENTKDSVGKKS